MKYEGDAVQYSSWALVAIESVWPNPDGDELSPDADDLAVYEAEGGNNYKSSVRPSFGVTGPSTERDFHSTQGYYKIVPLNVVSAKTNTTMSGSSFSVTFTLDDLMLVTKKDNLSNMLSASGLPMSPNDLVESDMDGALPQLLETNTEEISWKYVKDSDLGLSRYRISGQDSGFNVEDLVSENDTVTIWIYNDPQDFYQKDDLPYQIGDVLLPNDGISNIIGSGDRRSQLSTSSPSFNETLLGRLGITNEILSESIETLLASGYDEETAVGQIPQVNQNNLYRTLNNYVDTVSSSSNLIDYVFEDSLGTSLNETFPEMDSSHRDAIEYMVDVFHRPRGALESGEHIDEAEVASSRVRRERAAIQELISLLKPLEHDEIKDLYMAERMYYEDDRWNQITSVISSNRLDKLSSDADIEKFIQGLNGFAGGINEKTHEFATEYIQRKIISRTRQTFANGRVALVNESHGETPYLALKGSISRVEANVGASGNSFAVTISGVGLEKVLETSEVYYESLISPSLEGAAAGEHNAVYVHMSPANAIRHIVNRWAPKQVIFGPKNAFNQAVALAFAIIPEALATPEDEGVVVEDDDPLKDPFFDGEVPVRGYYILRTMVNATLDDVRIFAPVNYIDTTRIGEMSRAMTMSYADVDSDAVLNVPISMDDKRSIMENIRKVAGVGHFYQTFIDETGKLRYRLSFEAMERTPKPEYMPTIQDYDILAEGNSFHHDDSQLSTVVDVIPKPGMGSHTISETAFIGRSLPDSGSVPLEDLGRISQTEQVISPELYRYGMRSLRIEDVYQVEPSGAQRKAELYRQFYGQPVKKASVRVRNNTSYRVGETVLVSLQKNKRRPRTLIELDKWIDWLNFIRGDDDLLRMYVGVDGRMLQRGKDSFSLTAGEYNPFGDSSVTGGGNAGANLYGRFNENPHLFVLDSFLNTFTMMQANLPGVNVITPDYFPNLYWYYHHQPGGAYSWDENRVNDRYIVDAYILALRAAILQDSESANNLRTLLSNRDNPGLINSLRFQNFRATSYYIEGVGHNFVQDSDSSTSLSLSFGQDNLVLLDPVNLLPFGFISAEKKMKIGYDNGIQDRLWETTGSSMSTIQRLYIEQFKEDDLFKRASFLYNSQSLRNSSNYMYEIGVVREGMDALNIHVSESMEKRPLLPNDRTNTGAVTPAQGSTPPTPPPPPPVQAASNTPDDTPREKSFVGVLSQPHGERIYSILGEVPPFDVLDYPMNMRDGQIKARDAELRSLAAEVESRTGRLDEYLEEFESFNYTEFRGDKLIAFLRTK